MLTGGSDSTIHTFNVQQNTWELAGQMTTTRVAHAIQIIEDVDQLCP